MTENEFLLECLRAACGHGDAVIPQPPPDLDADSFLQRAWREGIVLALLPLIEAMPRDGAAATSLVESASRQRETLIAAHQRGPDTLTDVVTSLEAAGVPFAILKGPALSLRLHGTDPVRRYGDVDVIVPSGYRRAAFEALVGGTYRSKGGPWVHFLVWLVHFHEILEPRDSSRLQIELHWNLVDRCNLYRIAEDEILSRRQMIPWNGIDVPTLSLEDDFIYLAIHAAKHGVLNQVALGRGELAPWFCDESTGNRLRWYHDLHFFLDRHAEKMDWDLLRQRIQTWNTEEDVDATLRTLAVLLPQSAAQEALDRLGFDKTRASAGLLSRLDESRLGRRLIDGAMVMNTQFNFRPIRILLLARSFFPSPNRLLQFYSGLSPLTLPVLYLVHPVRMFFRQFSWSFR